MNSLQHLASAPGTNGARSGELRILYPVRDRQLWNSEPDVLKLLKSNEVMKIGQGNEIDLDWFDERDAQGGEIATAADLAIIYAIRGGGTPGHQRSESS